MREEYARQLRRNQDDLVRMGSRVEHALAQAITALINWDNTLAQQIVTSDVEIDRARSELETAAFNMLATQQPIIARDLRLLNASIAIASELERMGDYAKGVARCVQRCMRAPVLLVPPADLFRMAHNAQQMVHTCLEALIYLDSDLARTLAQQDELVDQLEDRVLEELMRLGSADTRGLESMIALRDVAHTLERLADRATNIAERVIFIATNQTELLNT